MKDYRAVFEYEGKKPSKFAKSTIERLFVTGYNLYCDRSNDLIEKFNSEYTGREDGEKPDGEYNSYMSDRLAKLAQDVYRRLAMSKTLFGRVFSGFTVETPCMFKAILRDGTKMYFHIKGDLTRSPLFLKLLLFFTTILMKGGADNV